MTHAASARCPKCGSILDDLGRCDHMWSGGLYAHRVGKKNAGRLLDGREWNEMPEDRR